MIVVIQKIIGLKIPKNNNGFTLPICVIDYIIVFYELSILTNVHNVFYENNKHTS